MTGSARMAQTQPTATLANLASGTTFAAKARAAELAAARAHQASAMAADKDEDEVEAPLTAVPLGALKFTKPRAKEKAWMPLNLEEIPETANLNVRVQPNYPPPPSTRASSPLVRDVERPSGPKMPVVSSNSSYPATTPKSTTRVSGLVTQTPLQATAGPSAVHSDADACRSSQQASSNAKQYQRQIQYQIDQINYMNQMKKFNLGKGQTTQPLNQRNPGSSQQMTNATVPVFQPFCQSLTSTHKPSIQQSPERLVPRTRDNGDDPFVDMPQTARQPLRQTNESVQHSVPDTSFDRTITPAPPGKMNYHFKFPPERQSQVNIVPPPGLSRNVRYQSLHAEGFESSPDRQQAPTADIRQRDPMPYSSFTGPASNKKDKSSQNFQGAVECSKAQNDTQPSSRTVLYDPFRHDDQFHKACGSSSIAENGLESLRTSSPLPWKDRPVDIFTAVGPPTSALCSNEIAHASMKRALSQRSSMNKYVWSTNAKGSTPAQRLEDTEKWWRHDGRGQETLRAYLEQITIDYRKQKIEQDYERTKRSLERQATFRDNWSESSHSTAAPTSSATGDVTNHLLVPVFANLLSYKDDVAPSHFNKWSPAPAWAVDNSTEGNKSFFGGDWGKPPTRVGRDRRYNPAFQEGRYTVFEPMDGRVSGPAW